ncbi:hypothetical protein CYMTET_19275 [Cymbomonas tetramitiformis]|uniref:Uncharacterized protein n=1 Tax=Cymbomonas tetramitiformis TaxID=36881 RepID=A0AAE0L520_9CHLO|nr:hypothetical protein CYMTET_19275 [Cymbomonas tetramitiformis]
MCGKRRAASGERWAASGERGAVSAALRSNFAQQLCFAQKLCCAQQLCFAQQLCVAALRSFAQLCFACEVSAEQRALSSER